MVLIQLNIPRDLDKKIALYSIEADFKDKRIAIIEILREKFRESGFKKFAGI